MQIALITDTHIGVRSDAISLLDHQKAFFDDVFFPYLIKNNIKTCFHLGDLVDRRKYINFNTLNRLYSDFIIPLTNICNDVHIIAGNHDVFYKDRNDLNALHELLKAYPIKTYIEPTEVIYDDPILFLPWICRENEQKSYEAINNTSAKICMGHLQLQGFEMHKGAHCEHGLSKDLFDKFNLVCSGHFHHKSSYNNIHYLGCPYEMNWGDYGDSKGFHIYDTKNKSLTFIPNPYSLFHKLEYNDKNKTREDILDHDFSVYKKSYIRIIVKEKINQYWFDQFYEQLEEVEPLSIQVIEDTSNLLFTGEETDLMHVEDTITLLSKYCDNLGISETMKPKLNMLFQSLYNDANNLRT